MSGDVATDDRQTIEDRLPSDVPEFQPGDAFALHATHVDGSYISNSGAWIVMEGYLREGRIIPYIIHSLSYNTKQPIMTREGALHHMKIRAQLMRKEMNIAEVLCFLEGRRYGPET